MYISNPLKEHASALNNLFNTHPPIEERIASCAACKPGGLLCHAAVGEAHS
jgi:Zn-dependent protease with chaperone function